MRIITIFLLSQLFVNNIFAEERFLIAADNQVVEMNRTGKVLDIIKMPDMDGVYDAWRLPDGGVVFIHRLGLVLMDAKKNILMEHKAIAGPKGAEINSVEVLDGGSKFAIMESGINKIIIIDRKDNVLDSISLPDLSKISLHFRYRMIRKVTGENAFWVAQKAPKTVLKVDMKGKVLQKISVDPYLKQPLKKHKCYSVIKANDGSLYTSTSDGCQIIHIDSKDSLITCWTKAELNLSTQYFNGLQLLKNGNLMAACSDFHLKNAEESSDVIAEISPEGKVVWKITRAQLVDQMEGRIEPKTGMEELRIANIHFYDNSKLKECLNVKR